MKSGTRRRTRLVAAGAAISIVAACSGRALDVGGNADAGGLEEEEAGLPAPNPPADAVPEPAPELPPVGLSVQGELCTITDEAVNGSSWPTWSIAVEAICNSTSFHLRVVSNAAITYPQRCSIATEVRLTTVIPLEADSGSLDDAGMPRADAGWYGEWQANSLRGSCDVMVGPTTASPSSVIAVRATVESLENGALDVSYRSRTPD